MVYKLENNISEIESQCGIKPIDVEIVEIGSDPNFIFVNDVGPRDGLQNQAVQVEPETRITLIQKLIDAGVPGVEVASFVSPKAVPRMAGAWEIMTALKDSPAALSALVPNLKGYEMARDAGTKIISVVPSATETMNRKNINMGYEDILALSCDLMKRAKDDGIKGQAYVSVAFECPFEGQVSQDRVMEMTETLLNAGAQEIIIADTIGAANRGCCNILNFLTLLLYGRVSVFVELTT